MEFKTWEFDTAGVARMEQRSGSKDEDVRQAKNQFLSSFMYTYQKKNNYTNRMGISPCNKERGGTSFIPWVVLPL